jgi:FixJ family two-component response regulator
VVAALTDITVYIIDDDRGNRTALARLLRSRQIQVTVFAKPDEFLATSIPQARRACLVSDVDIGNQGGLDLLHALAERGNTVPVILLSARDDAATREAAQQLGAAAFFSKPIDGQALVDAIVWSVRMPESEVGQ